MLSRQVFDPKLAQYAYLIGCQQTGEALIIDPERDVDRYLALAAEEGLRISAVAETHIHADFLSGARELAEWARREGEAMTVYLSAEGGEDWQIEWARTAAGGSVEIRLLHDGETFEVGKIELRALHTPGHTPEHLSFVVTDRGGGARQPIAVATGDFVFVGDLGRPDLLESAAGMAGQKEPAARALFHSTARFLELPEFVQVWPAHGAGSACGKALGAIPSSTVGYEKRNNAALDAVGRGEEAFVESILAGQPEPPPYFATMKRLNREGPPLLGELPQPRRLSGEELARLSNDPDTVVLDTRGEREQFMARHLAGSISAPLERSFPTIAGSYLRPEQDVVLVVEKERLEEAVRDLVRIGFDRLRGHVTPDLLDSPELDGQVRAIPAIDLAELEIRRQNESVTVLDVRGASEHAAGHVSGAINIAHTRLLEELDALSVGDRLLVHCQTGRRAASAASALARQGYRVAWVDDDFARWSQSTGAPKTMRREIEATSSKKG